MAALEDQVARIGRILLAGVLVLLPLVVTVGFIAWVVSLLVTYAGPKSWFGRVLVSAGLQVNEDAVAPYVIGLLLVVGAVFVIGLLVEHRVGTWLGSMFERLIRRIPVVSSIYDLSSRFTSMVDTKGGGDLKAMSPVWCFFGGDKGAAVLALLASPVPVKIGGEDYMGVLVPSAPVPVGGALIYVPSSWIKPADGGVENLMNVYVSMGVTPPKGLA
ncbi:MAG: DUF502 domain-containing protein [Micropepsaceae bacterium]